jgi:hypothetical protein
LLLAQGSFALVQLGLETGGLMGIPFGIVEPGCVNRESGFVWRRGCFRCWFRQFLADDGNQAARAELVRIVVRPDSLGRILIALRGARLLCGL